MKTMIRVLLLLSKMTAADLIARASAVYAGLNLNPAYPNPPVPMPEFRTAIDDYSAAVAEALDGGAKALAHRNMTGDALRRKLRLLKHYVEGNCNDDMTTFMSSGFLPVSTVRSKPGRISEAIRKVAPGPISGQLLVALVAVPRAGSYELRWAQVASGGTPGEWISHHMVKVFPPIPVSSLTPGATYVFQARALTPSGFTDWSDSVTRICI